MQDFQKILQLHQQREAIARQIAARQQQELEQAAENTLRALAGAGMESEAFLQNNQQALADALQQDYAALAQNLGQTAQSSMESQKMAQTAAQQHLAGMLQNQGIEPGETTLAGLRNSVGGMQAGLEAKRDELLGLLGQKLQIQQAQSSQSLQNQLADQKEQQSKITMGLQKKLARRLEEIILKQNAQLRRLEKEYVGNWNRKAKEKPPAMKRGKGKSLTQDPRKKTGKSKPPLLQQDRRKKFSQTR